jgi:hypothetical protein
MMVTYDSSFYEEIENYFEFEEQNEQFYKDLEDLLGQDGRESTKVLQPS